MELDLCLVGLHRRVGFGAMVVSFNRIWGLQVVVFKFGTCVCLLFNCRCWFVVSLVVR